MLDAELDKLLACHRIERGDQLLQLGWTRTACLLLVFNSLKTYFRSNFRSERGEIFGSSTAFDIFLRSLLLL